jgi:hypothetical protein
MNINEDDRWCESGEGDEQGIRLPPYARLHHGIKPHFFIQKMDANDQ